MTENINENEYQNKKTKTSCVDAGLDDDSMDIMLNDLPKEIPHISNLVSKKYHRTIFTERAKTWARILKYLPPNEKDVYGKFYVHYRGTNNRMDEWISPSCFKMFENRPLPDEWIDYFLRTENFQTKELGIKYIDKIVFGRHEIDTWYFSPYPIDSDKVKITKLLYICEQCLKYMTTLKTYVYHIKSCSVRNLPGREIYKKDNLVVFEIDGGNEKLFCQNLCLMSKFFMESKIRVFFVNYFIFYVFCEIDKTGTHIVGYFSKSKYYQEKNNLSCLMTLPPYQGKGYGKLMISFSYEISKIEKRVGTPEAPLSDLGKKTYLEYWSWTILNFLKTIDSYVTPQQISLQTCIAEDDVLETLKKMRIISSIKKSNLCLHIYQHTVRELLESNVFKPPRINFDASCLKWNPEDISFM